MYSSVGAKLGRVSARLDRANTKRPADGGLVGDGALHVDLCFTVVMPHDFGRHDQDLSGEPRSCGSGDSAPAAT